ncbi:uncharacterized protein LOC126565152 [Anopheles maculipalpis]|uniref:uncharacterized protein LOC126565152 n=1 Tax=Anopheles maculipalpis TaxID=1496333 RepID=UPI00215957A2|nr:uncharacterized protein LOC126565152 [Anopheles maculipalpis]
MKPLKTSKHTTNAEREKVVRAYEKGYNMKEIAGMLHMKRSTVHGVIKRFRETGQTPKERNSSYVRIINSQHVQLIKEWIEADHRITLKQIVTKLKEEHGIDVSKSTVSRTTKSLQDTLKTPRNIRLMARKSLLLESSNSAQAILPPIDQESLEANASPSLSQTVSNTSSSGSSRALTPPPGTSRAVTQSPEASITDASFKPEPSRGEETPPPSPPRIVSSHQRTLAVNRHREEINHTHNQIILNTLETVSAATNRLMEESRPQTDEAIFGAWVGGLLSEWSPPRRCTMKVAIRKMMLEARG